MSRCEQAAVATDGGRDAGLGCLDGGRVIGQVSGKTEIIGLKWLVGGGREEGSRGLELPGKNFQAQLFVFPRGFWNFLGL